MTAHSFWIVCRLADIVADCLGNFWFLARRRASQIRDLTYINATKTGIDIKEKLYRNWVIGIPSAGPALSCGTLLALAA